MGVRENFNVLKNLTFLTQFGLSVVIPMMLFIMLSLWLRQRFNLGSWVTLIGILLGMGCWIPTAKNFAKYVIGEAEKSQDEKEL